MCACRELQRVSPRLAAGRLKNSKGVTDEFFVAVFSFVFSTFLSYLCFSVCCKVGLPARLLRLGGSRAYGKVAPLLDGSHPRHSHGLLSLSITRIDDDSLS